MSPDNYSEYLELRQAYRNQIWHKGNPLTEVEIGRLICLDMELEQEWATRPGTVEHEVEFEQR